MDPEVMAYIRGCSISAPLGGDTGLSHRALARCSIIIVPTLPGPMNIQPIR